LQAKDQVSSLTQKCESLEEENTKLKSKIKEAQKFFQSDIEKIFETPKEVLKERENSQVIE
jgi:peptidoglycan hydrolase CwlO-like protein